MEKGRNGLPKVVLSHPSGSSAGIYLQGGQVTSWTTGDGRERLFLSRAALFEKGSPIRGGIPVVFPQFADSGPLPKHGWLRVSDWNVDESSRQETESIVDSAESMGVPPFRSSVTLFVQDDRESRALWPHPYRAELVVSLEAESLEVSLGISNTGAEAFTFTTALHTYLFVDDIATTRVIGLEGTEYIDKTARGLVRTDSSPQVTIRGETDRVYTDAPSPLRLVDDAGSSAIEVEATGFPDAVIWNPGEKIARDLRDMASDDYTRMICIEAAAVRPVTLAPGASWRGAQRLTAL